MTPRTVILSSFEAYLGFVYPADCSENLVENRAIEIRERAKRLSRLPFAVMLELSYAELDFANRWCWRNFGPAEGECRQSDSEYPACLIKTTHSHSGSWATHWFEKTDYNFGFNEWYFAEKSHCERFYESIPQINWGEHYPK
jgi:hypothetical protein